MIPTPTAPSALFSAPWVDTFRHALEADADFGAAARGWSGRILFCVSHAESHEAMAFLHIEKGIVAVLRVGSKEDLTSVDVVIEADAEQWERVMTGRLDPIFALMRKKLRLRKGTLGGLLPHTKAARRLVSVASHVPTRFDADALRGLAEKTAPRLTIERPSPDIPAAPLGSEERTFLSTSSRGLDTSSYPFKLWSKAKRLGIWNPEDIDFTQDVQDWAGLTPPEQDILKRLSAVFGAGEEAVTVDLLPLLQVMAREGRLEEEMYLTSFLWEEAKHVELFYRFFEHVVGGRLNLDQYHTPAYRAVFAEALPEALQRLWTDASPVAQAEASVTYNMIVEGVLAETGYYAYLSVLERHQILPGMQEAVRLLRQDEARHLAYGVYLLSRLVRAFGAPILEAIHMRMNALLPIAVEVINEAFAPYDPIPFGLDPQDFITFAMGQFEKRMGAIERAAHEDVL